MADRELRIRMLLEAADKITKPMREAAGGSLKLAAAMRETRGRMKELKAQQDQLGAFRSLKTGLAETSDKLAAARTRATELGRALALTDAPTKEMARAFKAAKREVTDLTTRQEQQHTKLMQLRGSLSAAGISTKDLVANERRLKAEVAATTVELERQQKSLGLQQRFADARGRFASVQGSATGIAASGASAMVVGRQMAAPVLMAAQGAMALEEAMADVGKVTGMTGAELKAAGRGFQDLSGQIPMAAAELAAIGASGAQAGVGVDKFGKAMANQRQQLLDFTRDAGQMGTAFDMSAEDAGKTMAAWRQGFGLTGDGARQLGDQINALTDNFGGVAAEVAAVLTGVGPLGNIAKTSAGSMAALAASMNAAGIAPEVAATGIKNMLLALTSGTSATARQTRAFQALGLSAEKVGKAMQLDSQGTILSVLQKIRGMSGEQQTATLSQLFGKEALLAIAPLLSNMDGLESRLNLVGDASQYAGSMLREFENRSGTGATKIQLAKNGLDNLKAAFGDQLIPTIKSGAETVLGWTNALRAWAQEHPNVAKALGMTLALASGLFVVFGGAALVLAGLITPFAVLAGAATLLGIGLLPLVGIAAAVAIGFAGAAFLIYKYWGGIRDFFTGLWNGVVTRTNEAISFFRALPERLREAGRAMIAGLISGITEKLAALRKTVSGAASAAADWFREKLGIHSPSRVFATLGSHMMAGLDQGLMRGAADPIARITALSGRLSGAVLAGTGAAAFATAAPAAIAPQPAPVTYQITINAPSGHAQDIAAAVRQAIEDLDRQNRARRFGDG